MPFSDLPEATCVTRVFRSLRHPWRGLPTPDPKARPRKAGRKHAVHRLDQHDAGAGCVDVPESPGDYGGAISAIAPAVSMLVGPRR